MPSINLLPKELNIKKEIMRSGKSKVAFTISLLLVFSSVMLLVCLYVSNYYSLKKNESLSSKIKIADEKIEKEVFDNKFLIAEVKAKEDSSLLAKHTYFTRAIDAVRGNLIDGVYLNELSISSEESDEEEFVDFKFNGIARNYASIASQARIFKNLSYVENVSVESVSNDKNGYKDFDGTIRFKKEIVFYEN